MDNIDLVNMNLTNLGPDWNNRVHTVVMNPPFGTKHNKGLDMVFLQVNHLVVTNTTNTNAGRPGDGQQRGVLPTQNYY